MPSVIATITAMPASAASMIASAANGGGTKIIVALAPVASTASAHGVEDRHAQRGRPAAAGRDPADQVRAVGLALLGVERPGLAGDALTDQPRVLVDQDAHEFPIGVGRIGSDVATMRSTSVSRLDRYKAVDRCSPVHAAPLAAATTFLAASVSPSAVMILRPLSLSSFLPSLDVRPLEPDDQRDAEIELVVGRQQGRGDRVALHDAAEDVDQHRLDPRLAEQDAEPLEHLVLVGAAADVEEVGRLAAVVLDQVHRAHRQARRR